MDNTEENNTQNCTPDEACNNPTAEQAPVTKEELNAAIDHLVDLADRYNGRVALAAFLEDKENENTRQVFKASEAVFLSDGKTSKVFSWTGACGYFIKAHECFDKNAKSIGEGVCLFLEGQRREKMRERMNPIAAMLGFTGCGCEECED